MVRSNSVLTGKTSVMNYVLACMSLFHVGEKEIFVKARGRTISKPVDVVELTRGRFVFDLKVQKIRI